MARNNPKPAEKLDWINDDDPGKIIAPSIAQKLAGWVKDQLPPAQRFNWFWNLISNLQIYLQAQVEDWIVIDSDSDEGDYATLAAYIADAPTAGDRILIKEDQTVTIQTIIPDNVTLKFLDGARLLCATNIATSVLKFGDNIIVEGVLNIVLSHTGTTAKAVEIDGDNANGKINVENSSTGLLSTGYHINANKVGNDIQGLIQNTGSGGLIDGLIDNSTKDSNSIVIRDSANNALHRGQADGSVTEKTKTIDIGPWNMNTTGSIAVNHGLDHTKIRGAAAIIRSDGSNIRGHLNGGVSPSDTTQQGFIGDIGSATVALLRLTGGRWDAVGYQIVSQNINAAAAVDKGNGLVGIPITGHILLANENTTLAGTTNYDGSHKIISETANEIVIAATYIAEIFAGTETASLNRGWIRITYIA